MKEYLLGEWMAHVVELGEMVNTGEVMFVNGIKVTVIREEHMRLIRE